MLLPALSFKVRLCCWTRPDIHTALETMALKLIKKVGLKAPSAASAQTSPQKAGRPRVDPSTLTSQKKVTRGQGSKTAKPAAAPINVYVWQCSSDCDGWLAAPNADSKLYAVMLEHEAWPSVTDSIVAGLNAFLQHAIDASDAIEGEGYFASLNDMKTQTCIVLNLQ